MLYLGGRAHAKFRRQGPRVAVNHPRLRNSAGAAAHPRPGPQLGMAQNGAWQRTDLLGCVL
jgi:hypothetical protein